MTMITRPHAPRPFRAPEVEEPDFVVVPRIRSRVNAIAAQVLDRVEADGPVTEDGTPHPLLAALAALVDSGTSLRSLAMQRRITTLLAEARGL